MQRNTEVVDTMLVAVCSGPVFCDTEKLAFLCISSSSSPSIYKNLHLIYPVLGKYSHHLYFFFVGKKKKRRSKEGKYMKDTERDQGRELIKSN